MPNKNIMKEIGKTALYTAGLVAVMLIIYALMGKFTFSVLVSGVLGGTVAMANLFLLAVTIEKAVAKSEGKARGVMGASYILRLAFIAGVVIFAIKNEYLNYVAVVIPLVFPQIIIKFLHTRPEGKKKNEC